MNILALDLGSTTGYCLGGKEGIINRGPIDFRNKGKFNEKSFVMFNDWLWSVCNSIEHPVSLISVEKPLVISSRPWGARVAYGQLGIVQLVSGSLGIPWVDTPPATIKKYWTGKGNCCKDLMVETTRKLHPDVTSHDESDAIALWYYTKEVMDVFKAK